VLYTIGLQKILKRNGHLVFGVNKTVAALRFYDLVWTRTYD
jgi:hypothetical protein